MVAEVAQRKQNGFLQIFLLKLLRSSISCLLVRNLVLLPKAANDLLTGPFIITGFFPLACLLVRNHLFYIKKKWPLLVFEVADSREGRKH